MAIVTWFSLIRSLAIETWRAHPSARALTELTKVMEAKGIPEKVRTEARFVARRHPRIPGLT